MANEDAARDHVLTVTVTVQYVYHADAILLGAVTVRKGIPCLELYQEEYRTRCLLYSQTKPRLTGKQFVLT